MLRNFRVYVTNFILPHRNMDRNEDIELRRNMHSNNTRLYSALGDNSDSENDESDALLSNMTSRSSRKNRPFSMNMSSMALNIRNLYNSLYPSYRSENVVDNAPQEIDATEGTTSGTSINENQKPRNRKPTTLKEKLATHVRDRSGVKVVNVMPDEARLMGKGIVLTTIKNTAKIIGSISVALVAAKITKKAMKWSHTSSNAEILPALITTFGPTIVERVSKSYSSKSSQDQKPILPPIPIVPGIMPGKEEKNLEPNIPLTDDLRPPNNDSEKFGSREGADYAINMALSHRIASIFGEGVSDWAKDIVDITTKHSTGYKIVFEEMLNETKEKRGHLIKKYPELEHNFKILKGRIEYVLNAVKNEQKEWFTYLEELLDAWEITCKIPLESVNIAHYQKKDDNNGIEEGDLEKTAATIAKIDSSMQYVPVGARPVVKAFFQNMTTQSLPHSDEPRSILFSVGLTGVGKSSATTACAKILGKDPIETNMEIYAETINGEPLKNKPRRSGAKEYLTPQALLGPFYEWIKKGDLSYPMIVNEADLNDPDLIDFFKRILDPNFKGFSIAYPAAQGFEFPIDTSKMPLILSANPESDITDPAILRRVSRAVWGAASDEVKNYLTSIEFTKELGKLQKEKFSEEDIEKISAIFSKAAAYILKQNKYDEEGAGNLKTVINDVFIEIKLRFIQSKQPIFPEPALEEKTQHHFLEINDEDIPIDLRNYVHDMINSHQNIDLIEDRTRYFMRNKKHKWSKVKADFSVDQLKDIIEKDENFSTLSLVQKIKVMHNILRIQSKKYEEAHRSDEHDRSFLKLDELIDLTIKMIPVEKKYKGSRGPTMIVRSRYYDATINHLRAREALYKIPTNVKNISQKQKEGRNIEKFEEINKAVTEIKEFSENFFLINQQPILEEFIDNVRENTLPFNRSNILSGIHSNIAHPVLLIEDAEDTQIATFIKETFNKIDKEVVHIPMSKFSKILSTKYIIAPNEWQESLKDMLKEAHDLIESKDAGCLIHISGYDPFNFDHATAIQQIFNRKNEKKFNLTFHYSWDGAVQFNFDILHSPIVISSHFMENLVNQTVGYTSWQEKPKLQYKKAVPEIREKTARETFNRQVALLNQYANIATSSKVNIINKVKESITYILNQDKNEENNPSLKIMSEAIEACFTLERKQHEIKGKDAIELSIVSDEEISLDQNAIWPQAPVPLDLKMVIDEIYKKTAKQKPQSSTDSIVSIDEKSDKATSVKSGVNYLMQNKEKWVKEGKAKLSVKDLRKICEEENSFFSNLKLYERLEVIHDFLTIQFQDYVENCHDKRLRRSIRGIDNLIQVTIKAVKSSKIIERHPDIDVKNLNYDDVITHLMVRETLCKIPSKVKNISRVPDDGNIENIRTINQAVSDIINAEKDFLDEDKKSILKYFFEKMRDETLTFKQKYTPRPMLIIEGAKYFKSDIKEYFGDIFNKFGKDVVHISMQRWIEIDQNKAVVATNLRHESLKEILEEVYEFIESADTGCPIHIFDYNPYDPNHVEAIKWLSTPKSKLNFSLGFYYNPNPEVKFNLPIRHSPIIITSDLEPISENPLDKNIPRLAFEFSSSEIKEKQAASALKAEIDLLEKLPDLEEKDKDALIIKAQDATNYILKKSQVYGPGPYTEYMLDILDQTFRRSRINYTPKDKNLNTAFSSASDKKQSRRASLGTQEFVNGLYKYKNTKMAKTFEEILGNMKVDKVPATTEASVDNQPTLDDYDFIVHVPSDSKLEELALELAGTGTIDEFQNLLEENKDNTKFIDFKDKYHNTLLHVAALYGRSEIVQILLTETNISILPNGNGFTPLHLAAEKGHGDIVKMLIGVSDNANITRLANPAATNKNGDNALHLAAFKGSVDVVDILLQNGKIDINVQNNLGDTALHKAAEGRQSKVVKRLLEEKNINIQLRNNKRNNGKEIKQTPHEIADARVDTRTIQAFTLHAKKANVA